MDHSYPAYPYSLRETFRSQDRRVSANDRDMKLELLVVLEWRPPGRPCHQMRETGCSEPQFGIVPEKITAVVDCITRDQTPFSS